MGQGYVQNGNTLKVMSADVSLNVNGVPQINPNKSVFLDYLDNLIFRQNSNFICFVTGLPGLGKSVSTISVCSQFAKRHGQPFSIKGNVASSIHDLVKKVADLEAEYTRGGIIRGRPLIYDDAGISMDSRHWFEKAHKMLNDMIEVFRYLGVPLFITTPSQFRVDSKMRDLAHAVIKVVKKKEGEYTMCKLYLSNRHWKTGDYIPVLLRAQHKGWTYKVDWLKIRPPSITLRREYDEWMKEFKGHIIQQNYSQLMKKNMVPEKDRKVLTEKQRYIYFKKKAGLTDAEISTQLGISPAGVATHIRNIRWRGYTDV